VKKKKRGLASMEKKKGGEGRRSSSTKGRSSLELDLCSRTWRGRVGKKRGRSGCLGKWTYHIYQKDFGKRRGINILYSSSS